MPARRLTRFEYEQTMHDLLGIDIPLTDLLPEDPRADGFDTVSTAQQISHFQLEKYLNVADVALDAAFERALRPPSRNNIKLDWSQFKTLSTRKREPTPRPKHMDIVSWSPSRAFSGRMPPTIARETGWYRISMRVAAVNPPADGQVWCSVHSGACFSNAPTLFWIGSFPAVTEERDLQYEAWIQAGHMLEVRPHDAAQKKNKFGAVYTTEQAEGAGLPGVAIKWIKMERISHGPAAADLRAILFPGVKADVSATGVASLASINPPEDLASRAGVCFTSVSSSDQRRRGRSVYRIRAPRTRQWGQPARRRALRVPRYPFLASIPLSRGTGRPPARSRPRRPAQLFSLEHDAR